MLLLSRRYTKNTLGQMAFWNKERNFASPNKLIPSNSLWNRTKKNHLLCPRQISQQQRNECDQILPINQRQLIIPRRFFFFLSKTNYTNDFVHAHKHATRNTCRCDVCVYHRKSAHRTEACVICI